MPWVYFDWFEWLDQYTIGLRQELMGPKRTLQDPRVPYKTPKELMGACGILLYCSVLKLAQIALYCNKETNDAMQYYANYKAETKWCKTIDCCCKWWFYWIVRQNLIKKGRWLRHAQYGSSMAQYGDLQKRIQKDIPVTRSSTPLWHWRAPYYKTDQNRKHK